MDPDELRTRIKAGEWVVDLRDRTAYAAEHIGGTIGIALGTQFSTYLGWLIPWDTPLTLIGESAEQVAMPSVSWCGSESTGSPAPPWAAHRPGLPR